MSVLRRASKALMTWVTEPYTGRVQFFVSFVMVACVLTGFVLLVTVSPLVGAVVAVALITGVLAWVRFERPDTTRDKR